MNKESETIESISSEKRSFDPPDNFRKNAHIKSLEELKTIYRDSIDDPEGFWASQAEEFHWFKKWDKVLEYSFHDPIEIKYFKGGKINVSYNCLDRHLTNGRKDKAAIIWEGEDGESKTLSYQELHHEVCRFANVLKKKGVQRGDRVCIYMPMIPELTIAMLACARVGAIHSVVFGGFSAESLRDRIKDSKSKLLITADGGFRRGKVIPLKEFADSALKDSPSIKKVIVCKRTGTKIDMAEGRDSWWHEEMGTADLETRCEPEEMDSEDPLFILYTSGSTGKPKGVLHTTGGYLVYTSLTFKWIFDYRDEDIFWCTADIGWVTGHSYIVYGPLSVGATSVMFEGVPNYPEPDRFWQIVDKYRVNIFYTAPTAIRALIKEGNQWPERCDLSSLRLLGTVGEPINPEAWLWYYRVIGKEKCPIVDTWWQTETGGVLITSLPGAVPAKPGSAALPFPGVEPAVLREDGSECNTNEGGHLVIKKPWPGIMRTVYNHPERFQETYFSKFSGVYYTGDGAKKDEDGYYWLMGRLDDVINVSGHRIGSAEVESALVSYDGVAEAAVVGMPHEIKGQGIYAFVTLSEGTEKNEDLKKTLRAHVREEIGPIAIPDKIHFADALPKTRSGKIMRRILRKIASDDIEGIGDTSTLADPSVVTLLIEERA